MNDLGDIRLSESEQAILRGLSPKSREKAIANLRKMQAPALPTKGLREAAMTAADEAAFEENASRASEIAKQRKRAHTALVKRLKDLFGEEFDVPEDAVSFAVDGVEFTTWSGYVTELHVAPPVCTDCGVPVAYSEWYGAPGTLASIGRCLVAADTALTNHMAEMHGEYAVASLLSNLHLVSVTSSAGLYTVTVRQGEGSQARDWRGAVQPEVLISAALQYLKLAQN